MYKGDTKALGGSLTETDRSTGPRMYRREGHLMLQFPSFLPAYGSRSLGRGLVQWGIGRDKMGKLHCFPSNFWGMKVLKDFGLLRFYITSLDDWKNPISRMVL